MIPKQKKKYKIQDYITKKPINQHKQVFTPKNAYPVCFCGKFLNSQSVKCYRCRAFTHSCLTPKPNRLKDTVYQCAVCLARNLDPIFIPRRYILQTFFQTRNIFLNQNEVCFQFDMNYEDLRSKVQVRGLQTKRTDLFWPMQGSFYLNNQVEPIFDLKPLMASTNRKTRRQQNFMIPPQKLSLGSNILRFKIPQLDQSFGDFYKFQEMRQYFIAIYSVHLLTMQQMIQKITRQNRTEKEDTLMLLKSLNEMENQLTIEKQKIKLICPYTCQRIKFPVRGKHCKHITCICFQTFMSIQKENRKWNCPICSEYINEPYVDIWMLQILNDNNKGEEVYIYLDGSYSWVEQNKVQSLDDQSDQDQKRKVGGVSIEEQQIKVSRKMVQQLPSFQIQVNYNASKNSYSPLQMVQIDQQIPNNQNQKDDLSFLQPYPFQDVRQIIDTPKRNQQNPQYSPFRLPSPHSVSQSPSPIISSQAIYDHIDINSDNQDQQQKKTAQKKKAEQQKAKIFRQTLRKKKKETQQIFRQQQKLKQQANKKKQQLKRNEIVSIQKRPPEIHYSTLQKSKSVPNSSLQQQLKKKQEINRKNQKLKQKILQKIKSQVKSILFKPMHNNEYVRKYCKLPVNQHKKHINNDLKKLFKNIL